MPEPVSIAVLGGGIAGLLARFLKRGFDHVKRTFDIITALMLLVVLGPVILVLALLVKLTSKGPAFFTQVRVGKDKHLFNMIKLRTMRKDAQSNGVPVWASKNYPRITTVARLLRTSHLDETPQLINILMGEMSLIGPRPERPHFVMEFRRSIPKYEKRLAVRPGVTGLAQVKHKYDENVEDVEKKLKYDLFYVDNMCWMTDIKIAVRTLRMIAGKNAR